MDRLCSCAHSPPRDDTHHLILLPEMGDATLHRTIGRCLTLQHDKTDVVLLLPLDRRGRRCSPLPRRDKHHSAPPRFIKKSHVGLSSHRQLEQQHSHSRSLDCSSRWSRSPAHWSRESHDCLPWDNSLEYCSLLDGRQSHTSSRHPARSLDPQAHLPPSYQI